MKPLNSSRLCFIIIIIHAMSSVLCRHRVSCQVCSCRDDSIICTKEDDFSTMTTTGAESSGSSVEFEATAVVAESYYTNISSLFVFFLNSFNFNFFTINLLFSSRIIRNQKHFTYLDSSVIRRYTNLNELYDNKFHIIC